MSCITCSASAGELRSLLGRERGHQLAHRGHAPCHLLEQLVERRRSVGEEVAVARHELVEGRLRVVASLAHLDQAVQLGQHVLEPRDVLGRHAPHAVGHLTEVRAHDLLADVLLQLVEHALGPRVDEPVLAQLADRAGRIGRQGVEERLARTRVVVVAEAQLRTLALHDLLEPLPDVLERAGEVEQGLLSLALPLQALAQRVDAGEAPLHAAAQQSLQRVIGAAPHEDLVGELLEHLRSGHVGSERVLGAVPPRVPEVHATSLRAVARKPDGRRLVGSAADGEVAALVAGHGDAEHPCGGLRPGMRLHARSRGDGTGDVADLHEAHARGVGRRTGDGLGETHHRLDAREHRAVHESPGESPGARSQLPHVGDVRVADRGSPAADVRDARQVADRDQEGARRAEHREVGVPFLGGQHEEAVRVEPPQFPRDGS